MSPMSLDPGYENYSEATLDVVCPVCGSDDLCYRVGTYDSLAYPHRPRVKAGQDRQKWLG